MAELEKCYTPAEVAELLGISEQTVRVRFRPVKGVLVIGEGERKLLRIPQTVLREWLRSQQVEG